MERRHFYGVAEEQLDFLDRVPDVCPLCHNAIQAELVGSVMVYPKPAGAFLEVVFRCPSQTCGRLFIGRYESIPDKSKRPVGGSFKLAEVVPRTAKAPEIPEEVKSISPGFQEILAESSSCEAQGLVQVAGVGYRKALEFLVKDYCIRANPGSKQDIVQNPLGKCIDKFIDDPKIKQCAQRAAWLGNDETHYSRRWLDLDINDLKTLIRLTVGWIEHNVLSEAYLAKMSSPR